MPFPRLVRGEHDFPPDGFMELECDSTFLRDEKLIHKQLPTGTDVTCGRIAWGISGKSEAWDHSQQDQADRKRG